MNSWEFIAMGPSDQCHTLASHGFSASSRNRAGSHCQKRSPRVPPLRARWETLGEGGNTMEHKEHPEDLGWVGTNLVACKNHLHENCTWVSMILVQAKIMFLLHFLKAAPDLTTVWSLASLVGQGVDIPTSAKTPTIGRYWKCSLTLPTLQNVLKLPLGH